MNRYLPPLLIKHNTSLMKSLLFLNHGFDLPNTRPYYKMVFLNVWKMFGDQNLLYFYEKLSVSSMPITKLNGNVHGRFLILNVA